MKTISVRDLRHKWPEAEAALSIEGEIIITRDSRPIARLVSIEDQADQRPRFDPEAHMEYLRKHHIPGLGEALLKSLEDDRNGP